jgi:site-specific DNA-methyltransferase (adenine-specific)
MIIKANAIHLPLKDQSVNCIVTSPPYWSLRKYDIPDSIFGGAGKCQHEWINENFKQHSGRGDCQRSGKFSEQEPIPDMTLSRGFCSLCGAWRGQLGLEPTINLFLEHLLQVMDECWRVLRNDGTMWVNLGDTYSQSGGSGSGEYRKRHKQFGKIINQGTAQSPHKAKGLPPKSLCGIPERFVIAMTDRGWARRNTVIWEKSNSLPSSAKDRFTVDFEPVFFFVKSRKYWFEQQYEPHQQVSIDRAKYPINKFGGNPNNPMGALSKGKRGGAEQTMITPNPKGRSKRCVWRIATTSCHGSHFATFPPALIEPMIRAGCPEGGIVLDPFGGSGTTLMVAEQLNRIGISIDLGYQELQEKRITKEALKQKVLKLRIKEKDIPCNLCASSQATSAVTQKIAMPEEANEILLQ